MEDILKKLSEHAKYRVSERQKRVSLSQIRAIAETMPKGWFAFESALRKNGLSFICEVKKASPSKGVIAEDFPYLDIAKEYEAAGADCVSVLTEPKWFLGDDKYLEEIAESITTPIIRKDFTVDSYMIYEAKAMGASAVLLICAILDGDKLKEYLTISNSLGISALVEAHDEEEIEMALKAGARIIGVNNRNLKDFTVDTGNAGKLRSLVPRDLIFVSESGIMGPKDVKLARESGADAVLIGESLMRAKDKKAFLKELREGQ